MNAIAWRCIAAAALFLVVSFAGAAAPTFRVSQVYTTGDGNLQYIELTEYAGLDGQDAWAGLTLTMTAGGLVKTVTFPRNLPTTRTAHMAVLIWQGDGTECNDFFDECGPNPALEERGGKADYYVMPAQFVDTRGGSIDFAGDHVAYPALPIDGHSAWFRDVGVGPATVPLGCATPPCPRIPFDVPTVFVQEFHIWPQDQFLLTADAAEIEALRTGRIPGWTSTGGGLFAYPVAAGPFDTPVCRYFAPPAQGGGHFLSAFAWECALLAAQGSGFTLESTAAFYVALPDAVTGACAAGSPVYRLWKVGGGADHRYMTGKLGRDYLVDVLGWYRSEGYGPDGVAFCVDVSPDDF